MWKRFIVISLLVFSISYSYILLNIHPVSCKTYEPNNNLTSNADVPYSLSEINDNFGKLESVAVDDSLAYVLKGKKVLIFDVSNLTNPIEINSFTIGGDYSVLKEIHIEKNYAYIINDWNEVHVCNITDPLNPDFQAMIEWGGIEGLVFDGDFLYCIGGGTLDIFNISNPNNIFLVSFYFLGTVTKCLSISGNLAYCGTDTGIFIVNITDKANMNLVDKINTNHTITNIRTENNLAYLTYINGDFQVVNITNLNNPIFTCTLNFDDYYNIKMKVQGNHSFLIGQSFSSYKHDGLTILDLEDPYNVTIKGRFFDGGDTTGIFVNESYAFLTEDGDGFEIIDLSDLTNPVKLAHTGGGSPAKVFGNGSIAIIAENNGGIDIINISNPFAPYILSKYDTGGAVTSAFIEDDLVYLANLHYGLEIINITNPKKPYHISTFFDGGNSTDVVVKDNIAFVADGKMGLDIINVTNPLLPTKIGQWSSTIQAVKVKVIDNRLFLLEFERHSGYNPILSIIDIVDLTNPNQLGFISYPGITGFDVIGNTIYVTANGIKIFDISNPALIREIRQIFVLGIGDISRVGNKLFATGSKLLKLTTHAPVMMFEIITPTEIRLIDEFGSDGYAFSFYYLDGLILLADDINDFRLLVLDRDIDGLYDYIEEELGTNPDNSDSDYDGISDFAEIYLHFTNPLDPDSDGEGLDDLEEITPGKDGYVTNPLDIDTDHDGYTDYEEFKFGSNPLDPLDYPHFRVWALFVGIYSSITLVLILAILSLFVKKQLLKREDKKQNMYICHAKANEGRLFKFLIFMNNKQKYTLQELTLKLDIEHQEILETFIFWNENDYLKILGEFDFDNELFTRKVTHNYPKKKATCYYCSKSIKLTETLCSNCGFEVLVCKSCDKPIQYGEIVSLCPLCDTNYHIDHLLRDIEKIGACPNCHNNISSTDIVVLTQPPISRFDTIKEE